jgi:hypothetical protein
VGFVAAGRGDRACGFVEEADAVGQRGDQARKRFG